MTLLTIIALTAFAVGLRLARAAGLYDSWLDSLSRDESEGATGR